MLGTQFGLYHSYNDFHLIQQKVEIASPQPRTNFVDIIGADGSKDFTEALGVGVLFQDREITWTFALYPSDIDDWVRIRSMVANAINGLRCHIIMDDDPDYYYDGRIKVDDHTSDNMLKTITVSATCKPYKFKVNKTIASLALTSTPKTVILENSRKPVVPTITVSASATIVFSGNTYVLNAGEHIVPDIRLQMGDNTLKCSGSGNITFSYREGSL